MAQRKKGNVDAWMPTLVDDWIESDRIALLTLEQEACYFRLLLHAWRRPEAGVPDRDEILARMCRVSVEEWRRIGAREALAAPAEHDPAAEIRAFWSGDRKAERAAEMSTKGERSSTIDARSMQRRGSGAPRCFEIHDGFWFNSKLVAVKLEQLRRNRQRSNAGIAARAAVAKPEKKRAYHRRGNDRSTNVEQSSTTDARPVHDRSTKVEGLRSRSFKGNSQQAATTAGRIPDSQHEARNTRIPDRRPDWLTPEQHLELLEAGDLLAHRLAFFERHGFDPIAGPEAEVATHAED